MRRTLSQKLSEEVSERLKQQSSNTDEARKKHLAFASKLQSELERGISEVEKAKYKYDESCRRVESATASMERGDDKDKAKKQLDQATADKDDLQNQYILAIHSANAQQKKHYSNDLPSVLDQLQALNERRTDGLRFVLEDFAGLQTAALNDQLACMGRIIASCGRIEPAKDSETFVQSFKRDWPEPAPLQFVPCSNFSDTINLVVNSSTTVFLQNKLGKLRASLEDVQRELAKQNGTIEGINKLLALYTAPGSTVDPFQTTEELMEAERQLLLLSSNKARIEAEVAVVIASIGGRSPS